MFFLIIFYYNRHEADLKTLRLLLRIKDSDKYRAKGAEPTLILKGTWQEFLINDYEAELHCVFIKTWMTLKKSAAKFQPHNSNQLISTLFDFNLD